MVPVALTHLSTPFLSIANLPVLSEMSSRGSCFECLFLISDTILAGTYGSLGGGT